ncbi:MAG: 30S ribosome-binding factor RbfA [Planctomycetota bacterium]|nr:MAG: 30S ribosome-binding factor RbfA [Planctomycetota bacterium]
MANPRTIARLEAQIQRRAAHCLMFEIADPRANFITITHVELAKDLSSGKIFYSVLGDESEHSKASHMLEHAAGFIQRQVATVLHVRNMPHLRWVYDDSIVEAARLDQVIKDARVRDREINPDA